MYRQFDNGFSPTPSGDRGVQRAAARREAVMKGIRPDFREGYMPERRSRKTSEPTPRTNREGLIRAQREQQAQLVEAASDGYQPLAGGQFCSPAYSSGSSGQQTSHVQGKAVKRVGRYQSQLNARKNTGGIPLPSSSYARLQGCDAASQLLHRAQRNQRNNTQ